MHEDADGLARDLEPVSLRPGRRLTSEIAAYTRPVPVPEHTERVRVTWFDTDAGGCIHTTAALRYAEAAESGLLRRLDLLEGWGNYPRRRVEAEYHVLPRFEDEVDVRIWPERLGNTSITWRWEIRRGAEKCVEGTMVAVRVDNEGRPSPLLPAVRERLGDGGLPA